MKATLERPLQVFEGRKPPAATADLEERIDRLEGIATTDLRRCGDLLRLSFMKSIESTTDNNEARNG